MRKALVFLLPATSLALDLTPIPDFKELEGIRMPVVRFADPTHEIQWSPPTGWQISYDRGILTLRPKDQGQSSMELRVITRTTRDTEALTKPDTLLAYVSRFLPAGAAYVSHRGTVEGGFTIGPIPAREYQFETILGQRAVRASVSFTDLNNNERLILVITAPSAKFEEVRKVAMQSMFSWQQE